MNPGLLPDSPPPTAARQPHYWQRFVRKVDDPNPHGRIPDGADLAALRRGADRPPGSVPAMWRLYTELREDGKLSDRLRAEHHTLVLFAIHQQSQITSMNWPGHSFGKSIRALLQRGRFSENALEDRFAATALTDSVDQLAVHVRGLVQLLRTEAIGLDYESVFRDLRDWQHPVQRHVVRRRWGSGFYGPGSPSTHPDQQSAQIEGVPQ